MEKEISIREQVLTLQVQELNSVIEENKRTIAVLKRDNKDLEEGYDSLVKAMDTCTKKLREYKATKLS